MKKISFLVVISIFMLFSCKKMENNPFNEPVFTEDQPIELKDVNDRVYIDINDLQGIKNPVTFQDENTNEYYDNWGQKVIERYYVSNTYCTIKARDYWGWLENVEYASNYRLKYQTRLDVYAQIEEALKNTHHIICYKQRVWDRWDRFGYGYEITGIVK